METPTAPGTGLISFSRLEICFLTGFYNKLIDSNSLIFLNTEKRINGSILAKCVIS